MTISGPPRGTASAAIDKALAILAPWDEHVMANLLECAAEASGNRAFGRAARALLARVGKHCLDDEAALAEMARVRAEYPLKSIRAASRVVAAKLPRQHSLDSAAKRLERKFRKTVGRNY